MLRFFLFIASLFVTLNLSSGLSKERLSNYYSPHFLRLLQIVFDNEEIISQGSYESVDAMFAGFNLNGKKVLDIGSGFGGVDIYLAQKFDADFIGVDREFYMTVGAEGFLDKKKDSLIGRVCFHTLREPTKLTEFPDNTFDIVFSKETFYHVAAKEKEQYLLEAHRVLKPGGKIIVADWFQNSPTRGKRLKLASTVEEACQFVMPETFESILKKVNFQDIEYADQSREHIRYTNKAIATMQREADAICRELGEGTYQGALEKWQLWLDAQVYGELLSGIFVATKSDL